MVPVEQGREPRIAVLDVLHPVPTPPGRGAAACMKRRRRIGRPSSTTWMSERHASRP